MNLLEITRDIDFNLTSKNIGTEAFINAVNTITPSKIRIYADEVTYNLHIILRLE